MCSEAQIDGRKTNHSLRAIGASELFQAGVPEKIIKERTGHHSLEALRTYERTTTEQHQAISGVLSAEKKITFQQALHSKYIATALHSYTYSTSSETAEPARTILLVVCSRRWEVSDKQRWLRPWSQNRPGHASRSPIVAVRLRFFKSYKPECVCRTGCYL